MQLRKARVSISEIGHCHLNLFKDNFDFMFINQLNLLEKQSREAFQTNHIVYNVSIVIISLGKPIY